MPVDNFCWELRESRADRGLILSAGSATIEHMFEGNGSDGAGHGDMGHGDMGHGDVVAADTVALADLYVPPSQPPPDPEETIDESWLLVPEWMRLDIDWPWWCSPDYTGPSEIDDQVTLAHFTPLGHATLPLLTAVPFRLLTDASRSLALQRLAQYQCYVEALRAELVATIAGPEPATVQARREDYAPCEVAVATTTSIYAADAEIDTARDLAGRLAATREQMATGRVTAAQARALSAATGHLDVNVARDIEAATLKYAHRQTLVRFKASLRRWVAKKDPEWTRKTTQARRDCQVTLNTHDDGTATLIAHGPLEILHTVDRALRAAADHSKDSLGGTADQRKLAALRDWAEAVLTDPTSRPRPHGIPFTINVTVTAATLLGLTNTPAEIPGIGPIPADVARWLIADGAPIRRLLVEEGTGRLLDYGTTTTYTVPPALAEHLINVHLHSAAPHSNVPAAGCDMEHNTPHRHGGATNRINCTPVDRRWHRPKTHAGWTYTKDPDTDIVTWTSPISGLTCDIHPYDYLLGP